jgi:DNA-directed RNA polymerase specialized sigma24 family protein
MSSLKNRSGYTWLFKKLNKVPHFRNVLVVRLIDGLSREEAAKITGFSLRQLDRGRQSIDSLKLCDILHKVKFF